VPSGLVGERTNRDAYEFLSDLHNRLEPGQHVQVTTDGHTPHLTVIEPLFGADSVDFGMLRKIYGTGPKPEADTAPAHTYSPAKCTGIDIRVITGDPDRDRISTSYVERQNLSMRMGMRRFTRLTNAFSKKVENHAYSVALYYMHYNFCKIHQTLRVTPAMEAGLTDHVWTIEEMLGKVGLK